MSNDKEKVLSDKHFMNADLALRNTNTIRVADSVHIPNIIPSVEMSTNVDILSVAQNVMST